MLRYANPLARFTFRRTEVTVVIGEHGDAGSCQCLGVTAQAVGVSEPKAVGHHHTGNSGFGTARAISPAHATRAGGEELDCSRTRQLVRYLFAGSRHALDCKSAPVAAPANRVTSCRYPTMRNDRHRRVAGRLG